MKKSFAVIFILAAALVGWYIYRNLGGTQELKFETLTRDFKILGEDFKGSYNSSLAENLFEKAKNYSQDHGGFIAVVNYGSDEDAQTIEQFIGVLDSEKSTLQESGFQEKTFEPPLVVMTVINAHNAVMPKPEEVRSLAQEFASTKNITLSGTSIEVYRSERELEVYFLPL